MATKLYISYNSSKINETLSQFNKLNSESSIGVTYSCWDLLHAGHNIFLADCKSKCDILVVGLQTDPTLDRPEKNHPIQTLEEREIQVRSCRYVDYYFIYDTEASLYTSLLELKPNTRFLGDDYVDKRFTGDDLKNISIEYHKRSEHLYSTTALRKRIYEAEKQKVIKNIKFINKKVVVKKT
jgi:glycerol-3-phosphate cytidylyltransferase